MAYKNFNLSVFGLSVPVVFSSYVYDSKGVEQSALFRFDNYQKPKIEISTIHNASREEITHAIFHESIHAICYVLGLHNCEFSHDLEEILADNIGRFMKDNWQFEF